MRRTIEIGLKVHKAIERARRSLEESENDILRRLLVDKPAYELKPEGRPWVREGLSLPHGSALRARYAGQDVEGSVQDGALIVGGQFYDSPSRALIDNVTTKTGARTHINGWSYWQVRRPGETEFVPLSALRKA